MWWFTEKLRTGRQHFFHFFFIFSDMHLHAYSKASYQTHPNTFCHLHKLQIISGTSVQIRIRKPRFRWRMRNGTGRKNERITLLECGSDSSVWPLIHQTESRGWFSNRPGSEYHSRCFYLPGRRSQEPAKTAVKVEKPTLECKSAQQHRLATQKTGQKKSCFRVGVDDVKRHR